MTHFRILILFCLLAGLSACAVFKLPTVQGNVIDQKQVDQLEIGMTPDQVRFLLGSPLVQGSFDPNRWDYVYYYRAPRGEEIKRSLNLYFEKGRLANITGQAAPSATTDVKAPGETKPVEAKQIDNTPLPDTEAGSVSEEQDSPISKP
jgi:outer membrane protein assembly factor BamE